MNDFVTSLIRTWVPIGIGAFITWLATNYDIVVPADASSSLVVGVAALVDGRRVMATVQVVLYLIAVILLVLAAFPLSSRVSLALLGAAAALLAYALPTI